MEEKRTRKLDGLPEPFLTSLEKRYGQIDYKNDFVSIDLDNYYKYQGTDKQTGQVSHKVIALPSFKNLYLHYEDLVQDVKELQGKEGVREDKRARELFELIKTNFRKLQRYLREERPEQYQAVRTKYNETAIKSLTTESLRDWFKKEKWVRISTSGKIAGDCGTSKNKKNPDRCLPKAKAQSLSKSQRAATARKKKKAGAKGKTVVKNTKAATVKKETANPQDGKAAPYGSGYKKVDKFAGSDPKAGSTIKGRGFDWKKEQIETLLEKCWKGYQKKGMKTMFGKKVPNCVKKEDIINLVVGTMHEMQNESSIMEKDDRCTRRAKREYDTWPSAYASGAVVRCRRGKIWKKK